MRSALATEPGPPRPNEDFAAVTDDLVVVLDGAGVPGFLDTGCTHGTRWFARTLGIETFGRLADHPTRSLADGLAEAISAVANRHAETCDTSHPGHPSATVAMLRECADSFEYLVLGDSSVAVDCGSVIEVFTDDRHDHVARGHHEALMAAQQGTEEHAQAAKALSTALRDFRNQPGGYWIAAVDPAAAHQAVSGSVDRSRVRGAAVLTDGASLIADRFHLLSWRGLFEVLQHAGPGGLIEQVREAELGDPRGTRWPRGKVHDDATAVFCVPGVGG